MGFSERSVGAVVWAGAACDRTGVWDILNPPQIVARTAGGAVTGPVRSV